MFLFCKVPWSEEVGEKVICCGLGKVRLLEGLQIGL